MHIKQWVEFAACSGMEYPKFRSRNKKVQDECRSVCESCPVINECLQWAIDNDESGMWGGTTKAERNLLKMLCE